MAQEARLNKTKLRVDKLAQKKDIDRIKVSQEQENLEYYQGKLARLETSIADCAETTPNNAYCHRIRYERAEVNHLIQGKINNKSFLDSDHSDDLYEVSRENFYAKKARFVAQCRNSDTHYAFIQNSEAYSAVCLTGNNKKSVTCTLF